MKQSEFQLLTEKFLTGSLTPDEEAIFNAYCEKLEGRVSEWDTVAMGDQDTARQRIFRNISVQVHAKPAWVFLPRWRMFVAAASIVLSVLTGYFFRNELYGRVFAVEIISVQTAPGKSLRTRLPDGTMVLLNAESKLAYPKTFRDSLRRVTLTGQAYFDVAHNKAKPFEINSNGLLTRVLGTRFVVKSYPGDAVSKVTVFSGKVRINTERSEAKSELLFPGQQLTANANDSDWIVTSGVDSLSAMSWATGKMMYRKTPLPEVLDDLERRFHVKIEAENHLKNCVIHADIFPGDHLEDVLNIMAVSLNGNAEKTGRTSYKLHGKGCD